MKRRPPSASRRPPSDAELEWIDVRLRGATELVNAFVGVQMDSSHPDVTLLDQAFAGWLEDWLGRPESERADPNAFMDTFGIAFGQSLVEGLGLEWKVVIDSDGAELAVHGDPGDFLVFPPNLVAKRFVARETSFLEPVYHEIARTLHDLREGNLPS